MLHAWQEMLTTGRLRVAHEQDGKVVLLTALSLDGDVTLVYAPSWVRGLPADALAAAVLAHREAVRMRLEEALAPLRLASLGTGWALVLAGSGAAGTAPWLGLDLRALLPLPEGAWMGAGLHAALVALPSGALRLLAPRWAGRIAWWLARRIGGVALARSLKRAGAVQPASAAASAPTSASTASRAGPGASAPR